MTLPFSKRYEQRSKPQAKHLFMATLSKEIGVLLGDGDPFYYMD